MAKEVIKRPEMSCEDPRHLQVIALRIQGKRWSEIAADVGITYRQLCRWREENPDIEAAINQESMDFLVASKHRMAALTPLADQAVAEGLKATRWIMTESGPIEVPAHQERLTAAKMVRDTFKQHSAVEVVQSAPIQSGGRLDDDELDRILSAG